MTPLTKKQHEVFQFLQEYIDVHQVAPSYREIMNHFSFSSLGTVYRYVHVLQSKGLLSQEKQKSRSISLKEQKPSKIANIVAETSLPFIGEIHAGEPLYIYPKSFSFSAPKFMVSLPDTTYVMQIKGDGFLEDLMDDGDYLLIEARPVAEEGETIVALLNETEVLIKKYFTQNNLIKLVGHKPHSHPLVVHEDELLIQGVVVGVIRSKYKL